MDRFRNVFVHAGGQAAFAVAGHGVGGHRDDGLVPVSSLFRGTDRGRCLHAVHDGHLDVHQNDVELLFREEGEGLLAMIGHDGRVARSGEHGQCDLLVGEAVFDQQNPERRQFAGMRCLRREPAALVNLVEPHHAQDDVVQFGLFGGFRQLCGDAQVFAALLVALLAGRREHDDVEGRQAGIGPDHFDEPESVHLRHVDVGDQQAERPASAMSLLQQGEPFECRLSSDRCHFLRQQNLFQDRAVSRVVIDDQDACAFELSGDRRGLPRLVRNGESGCESEGTAPTVFAVDLDLAAHH